MSSILPPASSSTPQPLVPQLPQVVVVGDPPHGILQLALGKALIAQITAQPGVQGGQVLSSPVGDFVIHPPLPFPAGTEIGFKLQALSPKVELLITAINGRPVSHGPALAQTAPGGALHTVTPAARGGHAPPPTAPPPVAFGHGATVTATVLGTPPPAMTAAAGIATAGPPPGPAGTQSGPVAPAPTVPVAAAGSQWSVRIVAVGTPTAAVTTIPAAATSAPPAVSPPPASPLAGSTLNGIITGTTASGQPLVQTAAGLFALDAKLSPPPGTEVVLEVRAYLGRLAAPPAARPPLSPATGTPHPWFDLSEALRVVADTSPGLAGQIADAVLPRPNAAFTTTALLIIAALRGGDLKGFLGDGAARILRRDRPGLAGRLQDDVAQMTGRASDSAGTEWRYVFIPIQDQDRIDRLQLFYRQRRQDDPDDPAAESGTRFVIDLVLSMLGHLQFDGLAREQQHRLDLIIRTGRPLPGALRRDIADLFDNACAALGLAPSLQFRGNGEFLNIKGADIPTAKLKDFMA